MAEQKLNIVFTGDVSQLTKAIQSAEAELTSFENTLKDSLGTEAFASINQSVDQLRQKFKSIGSIDIKANPQQALTAINEVFTDISKLKSNELVLKANNKQALDAIAQLQSFANNIKGTISVDIDRSQLTADIEKIKQEIASIEALKIEPDVSTVQLDLFNKNIDQLKVRLAELERINVTIDTSLDTSKLQNLLKPLSTQVSVGVNTKQAEVEIQALIERVRDLKGKDILINLDGTQVVRTIEAIEKELLGLQTRLKVATDPKEIGKLTQSLQVLKNSLSSANANQFSSTMSRAQNATFAFSQVLREAPAFAFSFQTGLLALSNNLPILADRFKEARASGLSFGRIFTDMGKSLFSLPGILSIASTAAIFLAGAFNKTGKAAKTFADDLSDVRDVISDSTASVQGDIARVQALANAFKLSEGSLERQKRIITELQEVNENYFGDLKAGVSTYDDITKAANAYSDALVQEAVIKGLSNAISKLSEQLGDATIAYADATKAADDQRKALEKIKKENATVVQGLTAQNREVNTAANKYNNLQGAMNKAGLEVGKINTRIEEFRKLINLRVFEQLKIKPLVDPKTGEDFKNATDDIVARARLFVKQFGDTFVLPDLDESFTNTKDIILKASRKLFDDLANGKLKIKIPIQVITETDFLPEPDTKPLSQAEVDRLQKLYFDQLKEAFDKKFVFDPSIALAIDNENIRRQFSDAIRNADFQGAIEAIDLDPKTLGLQGLNDSLKQSALLINETLTPAFQNLFDAIIAGEDPIKAFFDSIVQSINKVIQRLIQAAIQAAILSAISGGTSSFGGLFKGLLGLGSVAAPSGGGFIGGVGGSQAAPSLTARVSGTDLLFVLNQGQNIVGRSG